MQVRTIIAVTPVVSNAASSANLYRDVLGLEFYGEAETYLGTEKLDGIAHFGLWRLEDAARSCFGTDTWPTDLAVPQACIEFVVDDVNASAAELAAAGHTPLHDVETQDSGTRVTRFLSPDGLVIVVGQPPA